ncbi:MAG: VCBS repeat-containing protein [Thermoanaerobaculia bacterium]|nr:VCBS repeat-containing protein [Thermoanaerobaculia bacterium]
MKVSLSALSAAVLAGAIGCSSAGPSAPAAKTAAESKAEKAAEDARRNERAKSLLGLQTPADVPGEETGELATTTVVDKETGKKLLRIPKQSVYYEKEGRLIHSVVSGPGLPILRQDEKAYFVLAPPDAPKPDPRKAGAPDPDDLKPIVELPASEAAVVTPKTWTGTFRFEEISEGLPRAGMWRENFDMGDILGQGRPQIVAPPARLTGNFIRAYRLDKGDADDSRWRWRLADLSFENPDKIDAAYGAATLADLDADGKLDIVFGGHGSGPAIAFNKGGGAFKVETRGLPRQMSTRAIAAGDLNGDGRQDLVVISDDPEWMLTGGQPLAEKGSDYVRGYDVRGFVNEGTHFREVHKGLEGACFGYAIALVVPKDAKDGLPFYSSACRYSSGVTHLYEFDPKLEEFRFAGVAGAIETWAQHMGSAAGTYIGRPAAFAAWFKRSPTGALPKIDGQGITVYYRNADGKMAGKRIVKTLQFDAGSPAIAAGDLNGDGLDDVVWCDESTQRMRVFFQTPEGEFEELPVDREPTFVNHPTSLRIADFDGDGHKDVVLMYQYLTGDETRAGGFRAFRGLSK